MLSGRTSMSVVPLSSETQTRVYETQGATVPDQLLTLSEVAEHLGVPLQTIYTWRHHGEMPIGIRVGRHIRVRRPDLEAWLDARADPRPAA